MLARLFVILGGLVVVALFGALIAPLFIDWTDFRKDFEREASRILGQPVVVHGSVDARLIPFPSVTLSDVRVGEAESGEPLVQVAKFSMDAELAPFLSGEALIFDMRLERPRARMQLLPDGTLDWARGRRAAIPAKTVVLENVEVTDGEIIFVDEQTGRTWQVTGLNADLAARSLAGPWRIDGRAALDGEAGAFSITTSEADEAGSLPLRARLTPDKRPFGVDLDGQLKIADFRPLYAGRFTLFENQPNAADKTEAAKAEDQAGALRINGEFELTNERIRVPDYRLEVGPRDDPYLVTGEATLDTGKVPEFLLLADGQQIDVSRIGNRGEAGKTGRDPAISVRQRLSAMLNILAEIPIPQVPGRASLKLPAIVIGDTTVRDVRLDFRPDGAGWLIDNAVAQLPGRTLLEAKGRLNLTGQRAFRGDLLLASNQPSGLASWLAGSVDPAIRRLRTAGFSATVNLTDTLQQFERLEVAAGPATLKGRIERQSLNGVPPTLSIQLKGNRLDLEALQALTGLVAGDASYQTLLGHTIAADISAETLVALGEEARDVQFVATLKNGQLQAERVAIGDLAGAQLALSGRMSGALDAPAISARMKLAAEDMTDFFAMIGRHAPDHPAIARLAGSGGYYGKAALDVTLTAGGNNGTAPVIFGVIGTAGGSRVAINYQAPSLSQAATGQGILLEATLENPSSLVLIGQAGFDPLPFDTDANGLLSLKLQGTEGDRANGSLVFNTERSSFNATGEVDLSRANFLNGQTKITLETRDLEPFLLVKGIALPQTGTGLPLTLKSDVTVTGETVALTNLEGRADRNGFTGQLSFNRQKPGEGSGQLSLDTLDLAYLAEGLLGPVEAPNGGLPTTPIIAPAWPDMNMTLDLTAKQFWPGLFGAVSNLSGKVSWTGEQVDLTEATGEWFGGKLTGRLSLGNGGGSGFLQSRLDVTGADLSGPVWKAAGGPVATGKADLTLALEASGETLRAMAESMSGSGSATLNGLTIKGLNTAALPAILAAADGLDGEITADAIDPLVRPLILNGEAALGTVEVPFSIAGGTLRAQNVAAADAAATVSASLDAALPEETLAGSLQLSYRPGDAALAGAEPQVMLSFAGPIEAPTVKLDTADLVNFLSLRAFERERRRVEILQGNVLEKQRLRREVALYREVTELREADRLRQIEETRRRQIAAEQAARQALEDKARQDAEAKAAAAARAAAQAKAEAEAKAAEAREAARAAAAAAKSAAAARRAAEEAGQAAESDAQTSPLPPAERVERGGTLAPPLVNPTLPLPAPSSVPSQDPALNGLPGVVPQ